MSWYVKKGSLCPLPPEEGWDEGEGRAHAILVGEDRTLLSLSQSITVPPPMLID
jgi:hypothetical protein